MTLETERRRYIAAAVFTALFGAVYEFFSHQVYSMFMLLAFLVPLLGGVLPLSLLIESDESRRPGVLCRCLYGSAVAVFTAGCLFQGILEIYGTTSYLSRFYWISGALLLLPALLIYALQLKKI